MEQYKPDIQNTITDCVSVQQSASSVVQQGSLVSPSPSAPETGASMSLKQSSIPFPWKLHEMLADTVRLDLESIVSWIPGRNGFRVHEVKTFVDNVMPQYFNQTKYKSFQRQLNMWGFERIQHGPFKGGYIHEKFVLGMPILCSHMRRQKIKGVNNKNGVLAAKKWCNIEQSIMTTATTSATLAADNEEGKVSHTTDPLFTSSAARPPLAGASSTSMSGVTTAASSNAITTSSGPHVVVECMEFEGRPFFDLILDDHEEPPCTKKEAYQQKSTTSTTPWWSIPAATTGASSASSSSSQPRIQQYRGTKNFLKMKSFKNRGRRFSLEFLVATHE